MALALPAGSSAELHEEVQPTDSTSIEMCAESPHSKPPGPGTGAVTLPEPLPARACLLTVWDFFPSWLIFRGFLRTGSLHGLKTTGVEISRKGKKKQNKKPVGASTVQTPLLHVDKY